MKNIFLLVCLFPLVQAIAQDTLFYTISSGETLYKLHKIYDVSIADLRKINKFDSDNLNTGQVVKVYKKVALSEAQIKLNKIVYAKELSEKKLRNNQEFLKKELKKLTSYNETLGENEMPEKLNIAQKKAFTTDSINSENLIIAAEISDYTKQLAIHQKKILEIEATENKPKETKRLSPEEKEQLKKEKEKAKKIAAKEKKKEKKLDEIEKRKKLKTYKKLKKKKVNDKKLKNKKKVKTKKQELKLNTKKKKVRTKAKQQTKKVKIIAKEKAKKNKEIAKTNPEKAKKNAEKLIAKLKRKAFKIEFKKSKKEAKISKKFISEKQEKVKPEKEKKEGKVSKKTIPNKEEKSKKDSQKQEKITKEPKKEKSRKQNNKEVGLNKTSKDETLEKLEKLDALNLIKKENDILFKKTIKAIDKQQKKLDNTKDLEQILQLSKEKIKLTEANAKRNEIFNKQILELSNSGRSIVSEPSEEQKLDFDNAINIDINKISKEKKEKFLKDEKEKKKKTTTKNSEDNNIIVQDVGEVVIENKKKRIKYKIGDEVEKQLQEKARFYLSRAKLEIDKANISKARDYIDKSIKLNPSLAEAYILKGDIYSSFTYYDKALAQYKRASFLEPKNAQLNYNIGNCFVRLFKDDLAIAEWTKAIENDSTYILAYAGRASLNYKAKNYNEAIKDYDKIFTINKYFYVAYKGRGAAHLEKGNYGKAIIDFNNFLAYESDDSFVLLKRGMAKLSDNEIYGGCIDLLSSAELGNKDAEKALRKHCEK